MDHGYIAPSIRGCVLHIYSDNFLSQAFSLYGYERASIHIEENSTINVSEVIDIFDRDNSAVTVVNKGNINVFQNLRLTTRLTSTGNITISEQATLSLEVNSLIVGRVEGDGSLQLGNRPSHEHIFKPASKLMIRGTLSCSSNVNISSHLVSVRNIDLLNHYCNLKILPTAYFTEDIDGIYARSTSVFSIDLNERLLINRFTTNYNPTVTFTSPVTIKRYNFIYI